MLLLSCQRCASSKPFTDQWRQLQRKRTHSGIAQHGAEMLACASRSTQLQAADCLLASCSVRRKLIKGRLLEHIDQVRSNGERLPTLLHGFEEKRRRLTLRPRSSALLREVDHVGLLDERTIIRRRRR